MWQLVKGLFFEVLKLVSWFGLFGIGSDRRIRRSPADVWSCALVPVAHTRGTQLQVLVAVGQVWFGRLYSVLGWWKLV